MSGPDEARKPSLHVLMRVRDRHLKDLGYILRVEEHRVTRQVLLQCVKPATESLFGDVPDLDVYEAINLAMNRLEWKENRPYRSCCTRSGDDAEYNSGMPESRFWMKGINSSRNVSLDELGR